MSEFQFGDELVALGRIRIREMGTPAHDWERDYVRLQQKAETEAAWRRLRAMLTFGMTFRLPPRRLLLPARHQ